jgi:hypothetical protein
LWARRELLEQLAAAWAPRLQLSPMTDSVEEANEYKPLTCTFAQTRLLANGCSEMNAHEPG